MLKVIEKSTGKVIEINDELLDDKNLVMDYKTKEGKILKISEKEYRQRLFDTGGYTNHQTWNQGHEGTPASYAAQKEAVLKYKHFNPRFHAIPAKASTKAETKDETKEGTNA